MNDDFRIARRDAAIAAATEIETLADGGGNALYYPEDLRKQAHRHRVFAAWIDAKIAAHPYKEMYK